MCKMCWPYNLHFIAHLHAANHNSCGTKWKSTLSSGWNVCSSQVQLLISAQDVDNYKHIKRDLDLLRTMVEKSELWVIKKSSSGGDGKKDKKDKKEAAPVSHACGIMYNRIIRWKKLIFLFFFMQASPEEETDTKKQKVEKSNESYQNVKEVMFLHMFLVYLSVDQ